MWVFHWKLWKVLVSQDGCLGQKEFLWSWVAWWKQNVPCRVAVFTHTGVGRSIWSWRQRQICQEPFVLGVLSDCLCPNATWAPNVGAERTPWIAVTGWASTRPAGVSLWVTWLGPLGFNFIQKKIPVKASVGTHWDCLHHIFFLFN